MSCARVSPLAMKPAYFAWLAEVFEDAQVPTDDASAPWLDRSLRNLVAGQDAPEEEVYRRIRARWLHHGLPGRQLLAALLRDEVFARRDSPLRPKEGGGYYTADYKVTTVVPGRPR